LEGADGHPGAVGDLPALAGGERASGKRSSAVKLDANRAGAIVGSGKDFLIDAAGIAGRQPREEARAVVGYERIVAAGVINLSRGVRAIDDPVEVVIVRGKGH